MTAVFELVNKYGVNAANTKHVRVAMSEQGAKMHGMFRHYKAKFESLLSVHYVAAAILQDQELTLYQFEPVRYDDPLLRAFAADRVEVVADPALSGIEATVELETTDGRVLNAHCVIPKGAPENPLTKTEIEQKFRRYAKGVISPEAAEEVIKSVNGLEELKSVRTLMGYLRA
jgi:2-methylcitrate dehydratase PrpD